MLIEASIRLTKWSTEGNNDGTHLTPRKVALSPSLILVVLSRSPINLYPAKCSCNNTQASSPVFKDISSRGNTEPVCNLTNIRSMSGIWANIRRTVFLKFDSSKKVSTASRRLFNSVNERRGCPTHLLINRLPITVSVISNVFKRDTLLSWCRPPTNNSRLRRV